MINANPPVASAPVSAARPLTADDDAPRMTSLLAHAVLVTGELDQRMRLMLQHMSEGDFDLSPADQLRLQFLTAKLSTGTEMVSGSIPSYYTPLKEAAGKMG